VCFVKFGLLPRAARHARRDGRGTVDFTGKSIIVDDGLLQGLDELAARVTPGTKNEIEKVSNLRNYLLIYTNENQLEYEEDPKETADEEVHVVLPKSIKEGILKEHQLAGLAWLQVIFRRQRKGCLLADDMGLGKTLQVLAFLAWLIEEGKLEIESETSKGTSWNPILIVTPVTLLENEIWMEDMRKWFADHGNVFQPWVALHGSRLREFRLKGIEGRETAIGEAVLDLDKLKQHRIVLTNYETVVNYQHSFARIKWSVVVTDEAQEYKTASTKVSHALKSLSPRFRVACTGTPVETTLMDVWNIFDFLQPGKLLGSASEFRDRYGNPIHSEDQAIRSAALSDLKERLQLNRRNAFVLRREKTQLPGLPSKVDTLLNVNCLRNNVSGI
jgi:SNF2 family DNA or RNA helicase